MVSEQFRRQLRQESEKWWTEGLIDAVFYEKLLSRYQLDRLERDASNRFISILMGLGAILLGLGAITFVAANWQVWSRSFKLIVLLGCFVGINSAGFYLWRRPAEKGQQRLGHGLLLLGAMLLGANMGLMSQMFHQHGNLHELFLIWGLGVAAMAYSLRLTSQGVLALILVEVGYWICYSSGLIWQEPTAALAIVQHFPLVISLVFIPLAYWCRSQVLFGSSAIVIVSAIVFNLQPFQFWNSPLPGASWLVTFAFALPPALLWSYSDRIWQFSRTARSPDAFQHISRSLAIVFFSILFYLFSFGFWWRQTSWSWGAVQQWEDWNPWFLVDLLIFCILAGLGWIQVRHQLRQILRVQERAINSGTIALLIVVTVALFVGHQQIGSVPGLGAYSFNILLFLLALGLIRDGLAVGARRTFWGGMVLLVLGIVTRMLEYDTALLLKSIVFALCGAGVIAAGLWFERKATDRRPSPLTHSQEKHS